MGDVLLDLDSGGAFDHILRLAAWQLGAEVASIKLADATAKWCEFAPLYGPQTTIGSAFCDYAIRQDGTFLVLNAADDSRFAGHPQVIQAPFIRFFAGSPIRCPTGAVLGLLCVMDSRPRAHLTQVDQFALKDLSHIAFEKLQSSRQLVEIRRQRQQIELRERLLLAAAEAPDFTSAIRASAEILIAATGGICCYMFRQDLLSDSVHFMGGAGQGEFGTREYFNSLRSLGLNKAKSLIGRVIESEKQIFVSRANSQDVGLPPTQHAFAQDLAAVVITPFALNGRRYAISLGFAAAGYLAEAVAANLIDFIAVLKPLVHRSDDENSARLFRRAVEASSDSILITEAAPVDHPGPRILYANPAFQRESGYSLEEMLGRTPRMFSGPESSADARNKIRQALKSWQPVKQELLNYRKDKTPYWAELNIDPLADQDGWFTHWVSVNRNTTDRRASEQARMQIARELSSLIDAMPGVLMRHRRDSDGCWRPSFIALSIFELTGFTAAEASVAEWIDANTSNADLQLLQTRMSECVDGAQSSTDVRLRAKDGKWVWMRVVMRGHLDHAGVAEIVSIWADVSRELLREAAVAQSVKLAQLGEIATGMAHEINQPLAAMSLAAENALRALRRSPSSPARAEQKLHVIIAMAQRASSIIDHMKVFGRIGTGECEPLVFSDLLDNAMPLISHRLRASNVDLKVVLAADVPLVVGKAVPLEQVLLNLIANSCDAYDGMDQGNTCAPRAVTLHAGALGDLFRMTIRDSAGGIPEEALPSIFQPFFTTKEEGKGTGLGLSISYGIIMDLGGKIAVDSAGGMTTFTIVLPGRPPPVSLKNESA